jgi:hypothetical protein
MKKFSIHYLDQTIGVETGDHYQLYFPDGRQLAIQKYPDDTQTTPVENGNISYSNAFVWVIENKSIGPAWLNHEQLQVLGELIKRKEQELENA